MLLGSLLELALFLPSNSASLGILVTAITSSLLYSRGFILKSIVIIKFSYKDKDYKGFTK